MSIFFLTGFRVSVLLSSAVFLLFAIWKKPAKNCPIFLLALTFQVLIQQAKKIKQEKNLQVTCFANLWEDQLQQILAVNWIKCSCSNQSIKCGVFFTSQQGRLFNFFVRCENFALYHNKRLLHADPCFCSVIKEFVHAFSCAYIELWMYLGSLESTQKARVALSRASSYSYAFLVLSKLPSCICNSIYAC